MKVLKRVFIILSSIIFIMLIGSFNILIKVSADNNILTQEDVDATFKDPKIFSYAKTALYGIENTDRTNSERAVSSQSIYIGKKSFKPAIIKDNGERGHNEKIWNYMVFSMDNTGNINAIGTLIIVKYDNGNIGCNYAKVSNAFAAIVPKIGKMAVFAYDESSSNHKDYWQIYAVDESNNCCLFNSEKIDTDLIPKVEYSKIADKNGENVIDKDCFTPAYTLEGKPVEYLSGGAEFVDQSGLISD